MNPLRRRRIVRSCLAAAAILCGSTALVVRPWADERYVPGERTEGLVDTLARNVPPDHPQVRFVDVARASGIDFVHFRGERTNRLPEDMGSGVALGDYDGDGWCDLYAANVAGPLPAAGAVAEGASCRLFRNRGDGTFEDTTERAEVGLTRMAHAPAFADTDSDGDLDLFVSAYGRCSLLENRGDGTYRDRTAESGVAERDGFFTGVAVGDYDCDGALDLYVCNYVQYVEEPGAPARATQQHGLEIPALLNPSAFRPAHNLLLRNRGDGTFEDVAERLRVHDPAGRSLGAVMTDVSGDGVPDIYVANDVSDNALFVSRGDGTFENATAQALVGDYRGAMGLAVADYDGDLDFDIFITHWVAQENALYNNVGRELAKAGEKPRLVFVDEADRVGLGQVALDMVGWATGFFDWNCDGLLDLFVVNGHTIPDRRDPAHLLPMRSHLFWNAGEERGYFDVGPVSGDFFRTPSVGRGGAYFDFDLDGDEDLAVLSHGGPLALLRNDGGNANGAVRFRLRQRTGNRFAIGSRAALEIGGRTRVHVTDSQGSYLSQHAVGEFQVGLGAAPQVDRVAITWPDGTTCAAGPFPARSLVTWTKGEEPRVEPLQQARAEALGKPQDVAVLRTFYGILEQASRSRVAGDFAAAEREFRRALELWPGHEDSLYYLGNSLVELGREREALAAFAELVRVNADSNRGWMQQGNLLLPGGEDPSLDDLAGAERAFRRCHEINGEESGPVVKLGVVALLNGDHAAADRLFADAAALHSKAIEALWLRGYLAHARGDAPAASRHLAAARALAASSGADQNQLHEGNTRTGAALVARRAAATPLEGFRSIAARNGDPSSEYGALAAWLEERAR